jgi:hypothetical protein
MRDLFRDWRRWSMSERVGALLIAALLLGVPAALALGIL